MSVLSKFKKVFRDYKNGDERMGNGIKLVFDCGGEKVIVYTEEWDVYDGYDDYGSPNYWSFRCEWDNVLLFDFAKLMEYYLNYKEDYDREEIYCYFQIQ